MGLEIWTLVFHTLVFGSAVWLVAWLLNEVSDEEVSDEN